MTEPTFDYMEQRVRDFRVKLANAQTQALHWHREVTNLTNCLDAAVRMLEAHRSDPQLLDAAGTPIARANPQAPDGGGR